MPVQVENRAVPISNVSLVLEQFLNGVIIDHPRIKTIYDEGLSFDSALKKFRANQDFEPAATEFLPVFIFNREPLQFAEGLNKRSQSQQTCVLASDPNQGSIYKFIVGDLFLDYQVVFREIHEWEKMEALHLVGQGFTSNKNLVVNLPEVGEYNYQVEYEPLSDKVVNYEGAIYKSITSRAKISGTYLFFMGTAPTIKEIEISVENFNKVVYMDINCVVN